MQSSSKVCPSHALDLDIFLFFKLIEMNCSLMMESFFLYHNSVFFSESYLRNLCSEYSSALSQCGDRPDFLPTIRLLAAALSQLPPHFVTVGSSLLSALMPTDAVVLQVIMIFQLEKTTTIKDL